jgi:pilus assembly protein CpaE
MVADWKLRRRSLRTCTSGASALEFAIFAPILCLGLLAMIDIGMSVALRMELDRNVRSGAQAAFTLDNPASIIEEIVELSAGGAAGLEVQVEQICFCRIDGVLTSHEDCSVSCLSGKEPSVFFQIRAERPYTGAFFGERAIVSDTRVQIR